MRVHHLALRTRDVAALAAFYEGLGLTIVRDALPRALWLGLGPGAVLMIERAEPGEPLPTAESLELVAFAVTDEERVRFRTELVARGALEAETAHTLYLRDPDGRRVGLSSYPL